MIQIPLETFSYSNQSDEVSVGPELVRCSKWNRDSQYFKFTKFVSSECRTVLEAFRHGAAISSGGLCLGWRTLPSLPYQWATYEEVIRRAKNFGSGLISMGLSPGVHTMVGVYARNCPEWVITEQGVYTHSMVLVPLYDSLGPDARSYVISQCEMRLIVAYDEDNVTNILNSAPPCLKVIVTIKDVKPRIVEEATNLGLSIVRFSEVELYGSENPVEEEPPGPATIATICFSRLSPIKNSPESRPKGVMLSHENIVSATAACILQLGLYAPHRNDVLFSFLPLAHTMERCAELAVYMAGGAVGFYSGYLKNVTSDMKTLRPTILPAVPRFLNRIHKECVATANKTSLFRQVFNLGLQLKTDELYKGIVRSNSVWDKLLFWFVRQKVGGNVRLMLCGSAPIRGNVITFMRATMGCVIVEGYGLTECVGPVSLTVPGDPAPDQVGPPLPCNNIKLVDIPDMEYWASRGQGEICVMGANVFRGYFRDPDRTGTVVDTEGWLHTGDVGEWQPNGTLKIIDHKKLIFKLSRGEYVAPDKVEAIYKKSPYVAQVFVHGDSLKSCVVAVIVPHQAEITEWAVRRGVQADSFTGLCASRQVKQFILDQIVMLSKEAELAYYEEVKDIYLHPNLFSVDNGLLSKGGNLMRQKLQKYFKPQLEDMYKYLN